MIEWNDVGAMHMPAVRKMQIDGDLLINNRRSAGGKWSSRDH